MGTRVEPGVAASCDEAGDGGPSAVPERVVLRDGSSVVIRLLVAGDETAIASWFAGWFAGLDAETLYARSLAVLMRLDPRAEPALARAERFGHEAVVAIAPDGVTIAIARYLRFGEPGSAEVTVAVSDAWRERGLASTLLQRVAARARSVGIEQLTASCAARNDALIRLLGRLGATTVAPSGAGLVDIRIELDSVLHERSDRGPASGGRCD